ncbi:UPF0172-domain-containing protein [Coprinellus micaceus]|uniref:UPF0172-domain-containing protein n=1 Tax=Coprinellus micaceus TaxID=71717 RepID=A0A4Y7T5A8_COPMI|nr:UPF0172-domain-containing protein [Coprinellus micaceus]
MAPALTISAVAYYKLFFHAAKHPHQPVNGILLGKQKGNSIEVEDAVPLLHHWTSLSPMMEIGLDLAGQYADEAGLKIVAYYQAQRNVADVSLGPVAEKILQRLREKFKDALGLVIDGEDFGTDKAALVPWIWTGDAWRTAPDSDKAFTPGSSYQLASAELPASAGNYAFGDFDDHLEDVTIDWIRNRACIPIDA